MSGYGQFCPVSKAMELLDERWTLLVVRELLLGSMHSPREGQALVPSHASMNSYRPEEAIGAGDAIPGEPISGSMANRAPRTIQTASAPVAKG